MFLYFTGISPLHPWPFGASSFYSHFLYLNFHNQLSSSWFSYFRYLTLSVQICIVISSLLVHAYQTSIINLLFCAKTLISKGLSDLPRVPCGRVGTGADFSLLDMSCLQFLPTVSCRHCLLLWENFDIFNVCIYLFMNLIIYLFVGWFLLYKLL